MYSVAKDKPSQDALRERPGLIADKIKWLQRHDRECGDLYGMLPLIHGMPVATTDHIDRSPEKSHIAMASWFHPFSGVPYPRTIIMGTWDQMPTQLAGDGVRQIPRRDLGVGWSL